MQGPEWFPRSAELTATRGRPLPASPTADCVSLSFTAALAEITEMVAQLHGMMIKMENFQKLHELKKDLIGIDNLVVPGRVSSSSGLTMHCRGEQKGGIGGTYIWTCWLETLARQNVLFPSTWETTGKTRQCRQFGIMTFGGDKAILWPHILFFSLQGDSLLYLFPYRIPQKISDCLFHFLRMYINENGKF